MLAIYCRISKKKAEGKDVSISVQKEEGIKFGKKLGSKYKVYVDEGISGASDEVDFRPAFAEMYKAIKNKEIDSVYAFDQSRIERNTTVWSLFVSVMLQNNCSYYPGGNLLDLNDPENRLISNIVSATNQFFAANTGKKVKMAIAANAAKGKGHGLTAYGYEKDENGFIKIKENEAEIVRRIFKLSSEGIGAYTIANLLNSENIPTKFNSFKGNIKRKDKYTQQVTIFKKENVEWRGGVIHDMICNTIYKGLKNGAKVPPIIDEAFWEAVNKNLQENKKNVGKRAEYKYLLNGLLFCADCGLEYRGKKRLKGNDNAYKCNGKSHYQAKCKTSRGVSIPKIETFIITHLFKSKDLELFLMNAPKKTDKEQPLITKLENLKGELKQAEFRAERAYELMFDEDLKDDGRVIDEYKKVKRKVASLRESILFVENEIIERQNDFAKANFKRAIGAYSFDTDFDTTKNLIHSLIERITIKHTKEAKNGVFVVQVKYKGFDESSLFFTNWQALKWVWQSRYRATAITNDDLAEDVSLVYELARLKGVDVPTMDDFNGLETVESKHEIIELKPEELITFD